MNNNSSDLAAWLKLTLAPGIGGETQRKLLQAFGLPTEIFAAGHTALRAVIGSKAETLLAHSDTSRIDEALAWIEKPGHFIVTLADSAYPRTLLDTPDPPTVLYGRGNPALLDTPALAIVGSRNATPQGLRNAEAFAQLLAQRGLTIVSGLALGVDTAAHRGALSAPGNTIAVIGTGADRLYPAQNKALAIEIERHGLILSEFPLGTPPLPGNFPRRNRIISGLARGVLVVEAALESGSLITARQAAEQGRDVFAIPGSIHSPLARGCHRLIREGAKLVETAHDILEEIGIHVPNPERSRTPTTEQAIHPLLAAMGPDPISIEALTACHQGPPEQLLEILLQLELAGKIAHLPGNRYQRLHQTSD